MPVFYQDEDVTIDLNELGDTWKLDGIVIGNGHSTLVMQFPESTGIALNHIAVWEPTVEDLERWLKQSDDPVAPLYEGRNSTVVKAVVRKATRQLDQMVAWACYERDAYTCVYCGTSGVPLTYDHYLAQALGGQTTMEHGRTSCRPCNKRKGHMTIKQWKSYAAQKGLNDGEQITATA